MPTVADYALLGAEASPAADVGVGGLLLPQRYRRKRWTAPGAGARVDLDHKFAPFDGVVFGINGGSQSLQGLQVFSDYTATTPSVPFKEPLTPGPFGPAWGTMSSTVGCTWNASIPRTVLPGLVTWVWVGRRTGTPPSYSGLVCGRFANGSGLICNNSGAIASNANDDPSRYNAAPVSQPTLNEWVTIQCSFGPTQTQWFVGGSTPQFGTQTITAPTGWGLNPALHYLAISSDKGNGTRYYPSEVLGAFVIPRQLSLAEMRELDADPFQFLTAPRRYWVIPAPSSAAPSVETPAAVPTVPRKRWAPGVNARVNRGHPLAAGLTFAKWTSGATMVGEGPEPTLGVNRGIGQTPHGPGLIALTGASTEILNFGIRDDLYMPASSTAPFSAAVLVRVTDTTGLRYLVSYEGAGQGSWGFYVNGGVCRHYTQDAGGSYTDISLGVGVGTHLLMFTTDGANVRRYVNGVRISSIPWSGMKATQGINPLRVGAASATGSGSSANNPVVSLVTWRRAFSDADAAALYADPFQFLASEPRRAPVFATTAGPSAPAVSGMARVLLGIADLVAGVKAALGGARPPAGTTEKTAGTKGATGAARIAEGVTERSAGTKGASGQARASQGLTAPGGGTKATTGNFVDGEALLPLGATARAAGSKAGSGGLRSILGLGQRSAGTKATTGKASATISTTARSAGAKGSTGAARITVATTSQAGAPKGALGKLRAALGLVAGVRKGRSTGLVACIELTAHPVVDIVLTAEEC